jgi:hypothetical protein
VTSTPQLRDRLLKLVLWILCIYHVGIGLLSCLAPETTVSLGEVLYGVRVDASAAQFAYMLKALGMYALFTGGLMAVALTDPRRYRHLLVAAGALLIMRATTRLLFFDTLHEAFAVTWGHSLINVSLLLSKAGVLLWANAAMGKGEGLRPPLLAQELLANASQRLLPQRGSFASASGIR